MFTLADIAAMLEPVGIPINYPGDTVTALPCVQMNHGDLEIRPGGRAVFSTVDLIVAVEVGHAEHSHATLQQLTVRVINLLLAGGYQGEFDGTLPPAGDPNTDPPWIGRRISLTFHAFNVGPEPSAYTNEDGVVFTDETDTLAYTE